MLLYLVEAHASIEAGDRIDPGDGPGPIFAKIIERFHPQAIYGNPTRRQIFLVVDLGAPAEIAEMLYASPGSPRPNRALPRLLTPETYGEAIAKAKQILPPTPQP
jgi:hypothetical protein